MKYCLKYASNSYYKDKIDELIIDYTQGETYFLEFFQLHVHQKTHINVNVEDLSEFLTSEVLVLEAIRQQHPELNFEVIVPFFSDETTNILKAHNIPFWFSNYVSDWDTLHYYLSLGVTQVTIVENLAFELDKVSKIAHAAGAKVRVIANIAQTSARNFTPAIKKFFIRPEDVEEYDPYVDVIDFFYKTTNQGDTFYKIYAIDKQWFGNLQEIIIDLGEAIDNRGFMPGFAQHRIYCGKKCLKGDFCQLCFKYQSISNKLLEQNFIIAKEKEHN